jgi:hypothetical protein
VSVYGTDALVYAEAFLGWQFEESALAEASTSPRSREGPPLSIGGSSLNQRPFSLNFGGGRNIDLLAIVYALRPRLRIRLTLGGRTFPRKPWVYGDQEFYLVYRYSCLHPHFSALHSGLPHRFKALRTLSYHAPAKGGNIQSFGMTLIANHFRRENTR